MVRSLSSFQVVGGYPGFGSCSACCFGTVKIIFLMLSLLNKVVLSYWMAITISQAQGHIRVALFLVRIVNFSHWRIYCEASISCAKVISFRPFLECSHRYVSPDFYSGRLTTCVLYFHTESRTQIRSSS